MLSPRHTLLLRADQPPPTHQRLLHVMRGVQDVRQLGSLRRRGAEFRSRWESRHDAYHPQKRLPLLVLSPDVINIRPHLRG